MTITKWQSFDTGYGEKQTRQIGPRMFQVIELIDMWEATGETDSNRYACELRLVDLNAIGQANIDSAIQSCGWQDMPQDDLALCECVHSYGCSAPIGNWNGNNSRELLRSARREANELLDSDKLASAMEKPVNALGSTAAEYMRGDFDSAIQRGCESGNVNARIMAKMHGNPQEVIDNTRPADWLPYLMGYMCAMSNGTKETDPDTSPEYFRGYDRGQNVKAGNCPAPNWIQAK